MTTKYSFKYPKIDYNSKNMRKVAEGVNIFPVKSLYFDDFVEDGKNNPFTATYETSNEYDKSAIIIKDWQDEVLGYVDSRISQRLFIQHSREIIDLNKLFIRPISKDVQEDDDLNEYQNFIFDILEIDDISTVSDSDKKILVKIQSEGGEEITSIEQPLKPFDLNYEYKYEASENKTLKVITPLLQMAEAYYYQDNSESFFESKDNDLIVEFEPKNPEDKNAIAFKNKDNKLVIGYVPRDVAYLIANQKDIKKHKLYVLPFKKKRVKEYSPTGDIQTNDFIFNFCIVQIQNFKKIADTEKNVFIKIEKPKSIFSRILKLFWK